MELRRCFQINPVDDSCIFDVGWALPCPPSADDISGFWWAQPTLR
ncbi:hypothetical protein D1AOALGA4SA_11223 [Olavius algarvensis Delta 1 endosymbiont]|nr:hypothetical protein D1AOALGA4SA_11223 [Olavius algarvensis Delta 1 endosymbiont]